MRAYLMAAAIGLMAPGGMALAEATTDQADAENKAQAESVAEGMKLLKAGQPAEAIARFDRVNSWFEAKYRNEKRKIYCASSTAEMLLYMAESATKKNDAFALDATWADAIFFKGFALIDLGKQAEARAYLERALALSPSNSQYISELAEWEKREKNWQAAYELFERGASAAELVPEGDRQFWLSRAWRGMGYALIEMGRLDDAEALFRKCLAADPKDGGALNELTYIQQLRAKARGAGTT